MVVPHQDDSLGGVRKMFVVIVMDRSSSMAQFGDVPLRAINGYLRKLQQSAPADILEASVVIFDHATDILIPMRPIAKVRSIAPYASGQGTRLHGTVADVIERLIKRVLIEQSNGVTVAASVAVFTDGQDTSLPAGKHLSRLRRAVVEASELGFQLIAVGIGIDGIALAQDLWFPTNLANTVDPDGVEILKAAEDVSQIVNEFSLSFSADRLPKVPH